MDAVITYVDGLDPLWQEDYRTSMGGPVMAKRFRDWGTLRFLLRGIETHLPFVRNVYLVVSRESQVPEWASEKLKIVYHRDIIPERFLPVFNSTAIEMFLHRIPGLDEEFIYLNDDFFPLRDCRPEDFFRDGKAGVSFQRHLFASGLYKRHCVGAAPVRVVPPPSARLRRASPKRLRGDLLQGGGVYRRFGLSRPPGVQFQLLSFLRLRFLYRPDFREEGIQQAFLHCSGISGQGLFLYRLSGYGLRLHQRRKHA